MPCLPVIRMFGHLSFPSIFRIPAAVAAGGFLFSFNLSAQNAQQPKENIHEGYSIHQSIDLGGRIADINGSEPMYDTLVNMQSGPRILQQTMEMHAVPGQPHFFLYDTLLLTNMGYGGDTINSTVLRMSKGRIYDFQGMFRRDRQYFDYNLLANPLIPPDVTSNGYTFPQVLQTPHLYNTVRRMLDTSLTLMPLSKVSYRTGYSSSINQGPTFASMHNGAEAQLLQNWRVSTDYWFGAVDWKPSPRTTFTFKETITHYKGNINWQLAGPYLQLPNGNPVTLGYDQVQLPTCNDGNQPIVTSTTNPVTANPTCAGFQQLSRYSPNRAIFPTEEARFQSSQIQHVQMNGRVSYTGANMNLPQFNENFLGLDDFGIRQWNITGYSKGQRINVSADFGLTWQLSDRFSISEQYDFWYFRQPAINYLSEIDHFDDVNPNVPSMLDPPGAAQPASITLANNYFGQKLETNTFRVEWKPTSWSVFSLAYRYGYRRINFVMPLSTDFFANGADYSVSIHENGGIFGAVLHPTSQWKIDGTIEAAYLDNAWVQIDPRQRQRYQLHVFWNPVSAVTVTASYDDLELHDNQALINHQAHSRTGTVGVDFAPGEHYAIEVNYGHMGNFTQTGICYASSNPPPNAPATAPASCGANIYLGNAYYNEPTEYALVDFIYTPASKIKADAGLRVNAVHGSANFYNTRQVPGTLQSQYYTPFVKVAWTAPQGWGFRGEWNYYGYGEGAGVGPTLPRAFHTNLYTLGFHYEF